MNIEHLRDLQTIVRSGFASIYLGLAIARSSQGRQNTQRIIQRAWHLYQERLLNIPRFLACASHLLKAFNDAVELVDGNEVDLFINPHANGETIVLHVSFRLLLCSALMKFKKDIVMITRNFETASPTLEVTKYTLIYRETLIHRSSSDRIGHVAAKYLTAFRHEKCMRMYIYIGSNP